MNDAGLLHGLQRRADRIEAAGDGRTAERLTGGGKRIGVVEVHHRATVVQRAGKIDAELLDDVALDFGDDDLEHDLVAAAHDDGVDDLARRNILAAGPQQAAGDILGLLRLLRTGYAAGEDDAVADALHGDVGIGQNLMNGLADAVEVADDRNVETGDLLALGIEEVHVGLAHRAADEECAPRRPHHGVGDLGIGDQHILDVARQIDNDRFADPKGHRLGLIVAGGDMDGLRGRRVEHDIARKRPRHQARGDEKRRESRRRSDRSRSRHIIPSAPSVPGSGRAHAEAHGIDGLLVVVCIILALGSARAGIADTAQRERNRAELMRHLERLGL